MGTYLPKEAYDLLDLIAGTESPGYDVIYGGQRVEDLSRHPGINVPIAHGPNAGKTSSAAGRYQFIKSTWEDQANKLGLQDFSPESQDLAAWNLANEEYARQTGGDLLTDLQERGGPDRDILGALRKQWTSLPGGIEENARYRNGQNVKLADSGESQPDTGSQYLRPVEGEERARLLGWANGNTPARSPDESTPSRSSSPVPLSPVTGEERSRLLQWAKGGEQPIPEEAPAAAPEPDSMWERMKQEYGVLDTAARYGGLAVSSLAHQLPGMIDLATTPFRNLPGNGWVPEQTATEFFDAQFPQLASKPKTFGEKAVYAGVPALLPAGAAQKAVGAVKSAGKLIGDAATKGSVATLTGLGSATADEMFHPDESPVANFIAQLGAGILAPTTVGLAKGAKDVVTHAMPSANRLTRSAYGSTVGLTSEGAALLPEGVTVNHMADAMDDVMKSGQIKMAKPSSLDVMTTPEFRQALSKRSGVDITESSLGPYLRLGFYQTTAPTLTEGAQKIATEQRLGQQQGTTKQLLQPAFAGTILENAPLSKKEALMAAQPQKMHERFFYGAQQIHNDLQQKLNGIVAREIGALKNTPTESGEALRKVLSESDDAVDTAKRQLFQDFEKEFPGTLYHDPVNLEGVLAKVHYDAGSTDFDPRYLNNNMLKQILFDLNHEIGKEQPEYIRHMIQKGLISEDNLKEPLVSGVISRSKAEVIRGYLNQVLRAEENSGSKDYALATQLKKALVADQGVVSETSWATMPVELQARYKPANDAMMLEFGRLAQLTNAKAVKELLKKDEFGQYSTGSSKVGSAILQSKESVSQYLSLAKEANIDPVPAIRDELDTIFAHRKFTNPNTGALKPAQIDNWMRDNSELVAAMPEDLRATLGKMGQAATDTSAHELLSNTEKLRAVLGSDPSVTSSAQVVGKMLADAGQRGLTSQDLANFSRVSGVPRRVGDRLIGNAILQQINETYRSGDRLTLRAKLNAIQRNDGVLRSIYNNSPEIDVGLKGIQQTLAAKSDLQDIGTSFNSASAEKFAVKGMLAQKNNTSLLYRVVSFLAFQSGGAPGLGFGVAGGLVKGNIDELLKTGEAAVMSVYCDPEVLSAAYRSPNMKKALEDVAINRAAEFQKTLLESQRGLAFGPMGRDVRQSDEDQF